MAFSWHSTALLVLAGACVTVPTAVGAPNSTWPPILSPSPSPSFPPSFSTLPPMVSRSSAVPMTTPPVNNTNALNSTDAVIVIDLDPCTQCRDNAECSKAAGDGSPGMFCWNTLPTSTVNTSSPFELVHPAPCCCPLLQSTCLAVASSSCECLKSDPPIEPSQSSVALTVAVIVGLVAVAVGCVVVWRLRRSMKARVPPGASAEYPIMKEI